MAPPTRAKGHVRARYESAGDNAAVTLAVAASDVNLRTSFSDATFVSGPSLNGLTVGIEKPGQFVFDFDLAQKSARFQFHTQVSVFGKPLKFTYIHPQRRNATMVQGQLFWDPQNKISANYSFVTEKPSLKYSYLNEPLNLTVEPGYDFHTETWNFGIAKKLDTGDFLKAHYDVSREAVALEWIRDDKYFGPFKLTAHVDLKDKQQPRLTAEKTWLA